jgi:hypothetical protein
MFSFASFAMLAGALRGFSVADNQSKPLEQQKQLNPYLLPIYYVLTTPLVRGTMEHNVNVYAAKGVEMYKTLLKSARGGHYLLAASIQQGIIIGAGYQLGKLGYETLQ